MLGFEIARFDDHGLWSQADVWFSRCGTLLSTAEVFVNRSPRGYFADELARPVPNATSSQFRLVNSETRSPV